MPGAAVDSGVPDCRGEALIITSNTEKYMHITKKADGNKLGGSKRGISVHAVEPRREPAQIKRNDSQVGFSDRSESAPWSFHKKYICLCVITQTHAHIQRLGQCVVPEA